MQKPDLAGRMVGWAVELSEFDIQYVPRGPVKAQALVDFIADLTAHEDDVKGLWILSVDGSSNKRGGGAEIVLEGPDGIQVEQSLRFNFKASNNQAEYEALLAGMTLASEMEAKHLQVKSDSQLVVSQVQGEFQTKEEQLVKYLTKVGLLKERFDSFEIEHIPRDKNERADLLAKLESTKKPGYNQSVIQETDQQPTIEVEEVLCLQVEEHWFTPIKSYLEGGQLPEDDAKKSKLIKDAVRYVIVSGQLYRRGASQPLLRCVTREELLQVIEALHEGMCGAHVGGRALSLRVLRAGYYWPTVRTDCAEYVKKCDKCQRHSVIHRAPQKP